MNNVKQTVTIASVVEDDGRTLVEISIGDTQVRISPEHAQEIAASITDSSYEAILNQRMINFFQQRVGANIDIALRLLSAFHIGERNGEGYEVETKNIALDYGVVKSA